MHDSIHDAIRGHLLRRGPDSYGHQDTSHGDTTLSFAASLLQLRGTEASTCPIRGQKSEDLLLFNGEIFNGLATLLEGANDGLALMSALESSSSTPEGIVNVLSRLRGPWSIVYWHSASSTLWLGRDFMGRRSLLVHWPSEVEEEEEEGWEGSSLSWVISSVAVPLGGSERKILEGIKDVIDKSEEGEGDEGGDEEKEDPEKDWHEIPPGIYSFSLTSLPHRLEDLQRHPWSDPCISQLHLYERTAQGESSDEAPSDLDTAANELLHLLREAVDTRCRNLEYSFASPIPSSSSASTEPDAPVMVLFSGGVDSVIVAALSHLSLPPHLPIDLCNVCFDCGKSPDRLSALAALEELSAWAPERDWRLILVNSSLADLDANRDHLLSLLHPAGTVMDLNIGCALWLAAGGEGELARATGTSSSSSSPPSPPVRYFSRARVVLLGHGADEQCAGYGRHRTSFRSGGLEGLSNELKVDVKRMWRRNCGRDDRLISDRSREARHPFLDEKVMEFLMHQPLSNITDLRQPLGVGDKKILRRVLSILGLPISSGRVKRAIQFGSRIGKQANKRDFGSNRAANKQNVGGMSISEVPAGRQH